MKICLINNLYPPYAVGGAERVVERQAEEFKKQGNEVFIITTQPWAGWKSLKPEKRLVDGIAVYYFYAPNICWYKDLNKHGFLFKLIWHVVDVFNFWSARIIEKILQKEKPDQIYTHNLMGLGFGIRKYFQYMFLPLDKGRSVGVESLSTAPALRVRPSLSKEGNNKGEQRIKWTHYLHDVQLVEPSGVLLWNHVKDNLFQKIYSWIMKRRMGNPDVVVSPSKFLNNFYQSRGFFNKSQRHVETWHATSPVEIQNIVGTRRGAFSSTKFLYVGSLVEHKGIKILMSAWGDFCHYQERSDEACLPTGRQSQATLHIVGSGVLENEIKEWAKNYSNVKIYGRKEGSDLEEIYKSCDVLVFPSICLENCPATLVEAQKYGLRIIASDTGGVREMVDSDCLIEPGNVEELKKTILLN